jgi:multidrug efflux system membrane fusion protein
MTNVHPGERLRVLVVGGLVVAALLAGSGCKNGDASAKGPPPRPPAPVTVALATQADVPVTVETVGTVTATSSITVRSRVSGELMKVHFKEGDDVKAGDRLFSLDPRPLQALLAQATATKARDQALADEARADVARYESLVAKDYVTKEEYSAIQSRAASLEAAVEAEQSAVDNARLQLGYCELRAPMDGRTGTLLVHEGNLVRADDTALVVIHRMKPIDVAFSAPEQDLPAIRRFHAAGPLAVEATPRGAKASAVIGQLSFIDNEVDRGTGTIQLKASFPNDDGVLWPGQFADVRLRLSTQSNATVVPAEAVQSSQSGLFVFVVKPDMTAEMRHVEVGTTRDGVAVIASGVQPGEQVITDGQLQVTQGGKVEIKKPDATGAAPASAPGASAAAGGR